MELSFIICLSFVFSREQDNYNYIVYRKMIIINNENLISIYFDFLKISYFLIIKKIEFMIYYGILFYLYFQEFKFVDIDQDVFVWISFYNVFVFYIKLQFFEKNKYYYIFIYVLNYVCIFLFNRLFKERFVGL